MTGTADPAELLSLWAAQQCPIRALYARTGGETAVRIQGAIRLSGDSLFLQARDASLVMPLGGAELEYGPLRFVPPPFNKLESINGLHIKLKTHDWAFLTDGGEIPDEVVQLAMQRTLLTG